MSDSVALYAFIALAGVFVSSISQVMLKLSAQKSYGNALREYLNPLVIFAYVLFVGTTLVSTFAYRVIPLSMGPVLDATGYLDVTVFGVLIFHERLTKQKVCALALIILGIMVYSLGAA